MPKGEGSWNMARGLWYGLIGLIIVCIVIFYGVPMVMNYIYGWSNPQNLLNWWFLIQVTGL